MKDQQYKTVTHFIRKSIRYALFQLWYVTKFSIKNDQQIVFILGHMRSGSSLLMHLLISHPELIGYGERNAVYRSGKDLQKLIFHTRFEHRDFSKNYNYFVDQINHNHHTPDIEFLKNKNIKLVFLIRKPEESISSILKLTSAYYEEWPIEKACKYYVTRLQFLESLAEQLTPEKSIYLLTYDKLLNETQSTLSAIKNYLKLDIELKENYAVYNFTGTHGDPSPQITEGKIIRQQNRELLPIPKKLLEEARLAFEKCMLQSSLLK